MLLSAVSVLVVAQSSSEIPEGRMNNPVQINDRIPAGVGACLAQCGRLRDIRRASGLLVVGQTVLLLQTH